VFQKGHKKVGGRKRGRPNKATADIKALAQEFGSEAIGKLVELMRGAEFETVQVAAARELLDRGYGKSTQPIVGDVLVGISEELSRFIEGNAAAARSFVGFEEDHGTKH
jgi:hypothetical protein